MFEEVREKMCNLKEMVDGLFRPGHQISEEMRELIDLFDEATAITPEGEPEFVPQASNFIPAARRVRRVHDAPEDSELVGMDFVFANNEFLDPDDKIPLSLIPRYVKFMRKFVNLRQIFVPDGDEKDTGRGIMSETRNNILISRSPLGFKRHMLFEGFDRFLKNTEELTFTKLVEVKYPDFEDEEMTKQVPLKRKEIEAVVIAPGEVNGNICTLFEQSVSHFCTTTFFEESLFCENFYTPQIRDFVVGTFLNFITRKELVICEKEGPPLLIVFDGKIYFTLPKNSIPKYRQTPTAYFRADAITLLAAIFRLIYEVDFRPRN
jgi:hypothetical protein